MVIKGSSPPSRRFGSVLTGAAGGVVGSLQIITGSVAKISSPQGRFSRNVCRKFCKVFEERVGQTFVVTCLLSVVCIDNFASTYL